ncbi:hypothetical protein BaRGS_00026093 [Batillaria attramentaria]|uniref:Uncharacterized protein n=1 Tax=Batillaria attramentaria TaxID=370345 RepID=A0ABD0K6B1_9CAEN
MGQAAPTLTDHAASTQEHTHLTPNGPCTHTQEPYKHLQNQAPRIKLVYQSNLQSLATPEPYGSMDVARQPFKWECAVVPCC